MDGWIPYRDRKIGIHQLGLEEDSCREVSDSGHDRVYLTDRLGDGLSAVYSFFDSNVPKRSLGVYMILWLVERAREFGLDHVYLGFWIADCAKMSYKTKFRPLERYSIDGWVHFCEDEA